jgi:hypothetical protein
MNYHFNTPLWFMRGIVAKDIEHYWMLMFYANEIARGWGRTK